MKTPAERGAVGTWIRRERLLREWKYDQAPRELTKLGLYVSPSTYREWESGRTKPSETSLEKLVEIFGSRPGEAGAGSVTATDTGLSALVEQLRAQNGTMADAMSYLLKTQSDRDRQTEEIIRLAEIQERQTRALLQVSETLKTLADIQAGQTAAIAQLLASPPPVRPIAASAGTPASPGPEQPLDGDPSGLPQTEERASQ